MQELVLVWGSFEVVDNVLVRSEGLAGAGGPSAKVAPPCGWLTGTGCWRKTSVPCHIGFFGPLFQCPHVWIDGFLQSE